MVGVVEELCGGGALWWWRSSVVVELCGGGCCSHPCCKSSVPHAQSSMLRWEDFVGGVEKVLVSVGAEEADLR